MNVYVHILDENKRLKSNFGMYMRIDIFCTAFFIFFLYFYLIMKHKNVFCLSAWEFWCVCERKQVRAQMFQLTTI